MQRAYLRQDVCSFLRLQQGKHCGNGWEEVLALEGAKSIVFNQ